MEYQRIVIGLLFTCLFICPSIASGLELGVNVLPSDLELVSFEPSDNFSLSVDDLQSISITLDRDSTIVWYLDSVEERTDYNSNTSTYAFTTSTAGTYTLNATARDSFTNSSQVNVSWIITVSSTAPYTPPQSAPGSGSSYITPTPLPTIIEDTVEWAILTDEWYIPYTTFISETLGLPEDTLIPLILLTFDEFSYLYGVDSPTIDIPTISIPTIELPTIEIPDELKTLMDMHSTLLILGAIFSILFLITLKKGPGGDINPGRTSPIKL